MCVCVCPSGTVGSAWAHRMWLATAVIGWQSAVLTGLALFLGLCSVVAELRVRADGPSTGQCSSLPPTGQNVAHGGFDRVAVSGAHEVPVRASALFSMLLPLTRAGWTSALLLSLFSVVAELRAQADRPSTGATAAPLPLPPHQDNDVEVRSVWPVR